MDVLLVGITQTLQPNVVYELPARCCLAFTNNTKLQVSNLTNSGFVSLIVSADGGFTTAAPYIKCTQGIALTFFKPVGILV